MQANPVIFFLYQCCCVHGVFSQKQKPSLRQLGLQLFQSHLCTQQDPISNKETQQKQRNTENTRVVLIGRDISMVSGSSMPKSSLTFPLLNDKCFDFVDIKLWSTYQAEYLRRPKLIKIQMCIFTQAHIYIVVIIKEVCLISVLDSD